MNLPRLSAFVWPSPPRYRHLVAATFPFDFYGSQSTLIVIQKNSSGKSVVLRVVWNGPGLR